MKKILLITLGFSMALFASFSKNGNIVTDSGTGLQWQSIGSKMTWIAAIDYCENLTLDTYSDWRLPNIKELTSIVDNTKINPSIDILLFESTESLEYWSSTTDVSIGSYAWTVNFYDGSQSPLDKSSSGANVRCVRIGQ